LRIPFQEQLIKGFFALTMRANKNKRLTVLSEAEKQALYDLPDFDDFQRAEFFEMTAQDFPCGLNHIKVRLV
jgi:hypothetical protein